MSTKSDGVSCYDKAEPNEELFVLRAQDATGPATVIDWIKNNIEMASPEKLHSALDVALRMRQWPKRKKAD